MPNLLEGPALPHDPEFAPILRAHAVDSRPLSQAIVGAEARSLGAADVVWSRQSDVAAFALILEPTVVRARALEMLALMQLALGDSLGVLMPPKTSVLFRWPAGTRDPHRLLINGAEAGVVAVVTPDGAAAGAELDWLVVYGAIVLAPSANVEPGERPGMTCLAEEGGGELGRSALLKSVTSHFLSWLDTWEERGFRACEAAWLGKLEGAMSEVEFATTRGRIVGCDDTPALLVKAASGGVTQVPLAALSPAHVPAAEWLP